MNWHRVHVLYNAYRALPADKGRRFRPLDLARGVNDRAPQRLVVLRLCTSCFGN